MTTALITHPACLNHVPPQGHPERPARLSEVLKALDAPEFRSLLRKEAPRADKEDIARVHDRDFVDELLETMPKSGYMQVDSDTIASPGTEEAILRGAGALVLAVDMVMSGEAKNVFCAVRPPGHHACHGRAMGFCIFNQIAVAAKYALERRGLQRVAIVDFDVHHGNGTEDIFTGDERVLMVSFFQHPFYPYSGADSRAPNMVNLPVPAYTRGPVVRELIEQHWIPRLEAFKPEMIFISAGFDAHREDDLGQLGLVEADYAWITARVKEIANKHANGRIVSSLEGGYNLSALGRSVEAHIRVLADL